MVKSILLKLDDKFFYKMKSHKLKLERDNEVEYTWETYIKILFGMI